MLRVVALLWNNFSSDAFVNVRFDLKHIIQQQIKSDGPIDFASFMTTALYHPEYGYYQQQHCPIGRQGDFTTAPEMSPVFAMALAMRWQALQPYLTDGVVVEVGPGTGALAAQFLDTAIELDCVPKSYYLLELNPKAQELQQQFLASKLPDDVYQRCVWLQEPLTENWQGMLLANEILDAQPVHIFVQSLAGTLERHVDLDPNHELVFVDLPCQNALLNEAVAALDLPLDPGYCSEINLQLATWFAAHCASLECGAVLLIDYGYSRREYYHWQRRQGTLMAYDQHRAHSDVLAKPGQQDLTAHVDFSRVKDIATALSFEPKCYLTQAWFLLGSGALAALEQLPESQRLEMSAALKQLLLPQSMGEMFKVMVLTRGQLGAWAEMQYNQLARL